MPRIVMKFGGTSVADLDRIRRVADLVAAEAHAGNEVAVVVSAMSGETNRLVALVDGLDADLLDGHNESQGGAIDDEYDAIVASGEQVTSGLLAIALRRRGVRARSWLGWQIPLRTDMAHGKARIQGIENEVLGASVMWPLWQAFRVSAPMAVYPHWAGAARIRRLWRWLWRWKRIAAISIRTWMVSIPPIRALCQMRAA